MTIQNQIPCTKIDVDTDENEPLKVGVARGGGAYFSPSILRSTHTVLRSCHETLSSSFMYMYVLVFREQLSTLDSAPTHIELTRLSLGVVIIGWVAPSSIAACCSPEKQLASDERYQNCW